MNGPDHYREAERRLLMAWEDDREPENMRHLVAEAQVHATLALAAATALTESGANHLSPADYNAWQAVAATTSKKDGKPAPCPCGQSIPDDRVAYCSDECKRADDDHGPDADGGDES